MWQLAQVRVPLNTARACHRKISTNPLTFTVVVLAVQNMEASGAVSKAQEIEFMALGGSLVMMSKGWFSYEPFISSD